MTRSGTDAAPTSSGGHELYRVKISELTHALSFPVCGEVRRTSVAAGMVTALLTGGLPFVGLDLGLVMGRASSLAAPLAFALHLFVALIYGAVLSAAITRARGAWTVAAGATSVAILYVANLAASEALGFARIVPEANVFVAHLIFGATFTALFKLAEIGAPDTSTRQAPR